MALLTLAEHKTFAGITTSDPVRDASLSVIIDEACDAVIRFCQNGNIEQTAYTIILDAPSYPALVLPYTPVLVAGFELYLNWDANGNPAAFTSGDLKTMYDYYALDVGPANVTTCESGIVRLINNNVWGWNRERPIYSLHLKIVPIRGAIKVVYTAGYATVPPAIKSAINLITRKIYNMRKLGVPVVSESLNGYSYSAQGTASAEGIIQGDPTIRAMLKTFCRPQIGSYF